MARVHVLSDDLLFGSRLQAELGAVVSLGPEVDPEADAIVADLTHDASARIAALANWDRPVLAFYSHVEVDVRSEAEAAGFAIVVPRSRMAREAGPLVERLLATAR
jgi:hypothetical protein